MKLLVASTGASGQPFFVRLLECLRDKGHEPHVICSRWGLETLMHETSLREEDLEQMANTLYSDDDLAARPSSGSFLHDGMVILPCSMKTLSGIAHGYADNLVVRAADVTLKEGRRLILCPRETPLNAIHLENMLALARLGVRIMPPMPAFYSHPQTIGDLVDHFVGRVLDHLAVEHDLVKRWGE